MKEIKNILICGAGMMGKNIGYVSRPTPASRWACMICNPTDVGGGHPHQHQAAPETRASSPSRS